MQTDNLIEQSFITPDVVNEFAQLFRGGKVAKDEDNKFLPWRTKNGQHIAADGKDFLIVVEDHLTASPAIGVYPLFVQEDGLKVWWGCVDFDEGMHESYIHAKNLREVLRQLGVESWVERSRSKGFHVWVFFTEPMPASHVREGLTAACDVVEAPTKEVNPKQTELTDKGWGNGVRLPYAHTRKSGGYNEIDNTDYSFSMVPVTVFVRDAIKTRITPDAWDAVRALYSPPERVPAPPSRVTPYTGALTGLAGAIRTGGPRPQPEKPQGDRSATLWNLACAMARQGYDEQAAYAELQSADIDWGGKYHSRPDGNNVLWKTVQKAYRTFTP